MSDTQPTADEQRLAEVKSLSEVYLHIRDVLQEFAEYAARQCGAAGAVIFLEDHTNPASTIGVGAATGTDPAVLRDYCEGAPGLCGQPAPEPKVGSMGSRIGVPLESSTGIPIGILCVLDPAADRFGAREKRILQHTARLVVEALESRRGLIRSVHMGTLLDESTNGIFLMEADTLRIIYGNKTAREDLGYSLEDLLKLTGSDLVPGLGADQVAALRRLPAQELVLETEQVRRDGSRFPVELRLRLTRRKDVEMISAVSVNLSEHRRISASLAERTVMLRTLFDQNPYPVFLLDLDGCIVLVNDACTAVTGFRPEEMVGISYANLVVAEEHAVVSRHLAKAREGEVQFFETSLTTREGALRHLEVTLQPAVLEGRIVAMFGVAKDVTERRAAELKVQWLAKCDTLTGLPNRSLFKDRLEHALAHAGRHGETFAVMFLDLDRFKEVNDSLGHEAGDLVLQTVSRRLLRAVRREDTVARLGGDEFTLLIEAVPGLAIVTEIAEKIREGIAEPIQYGGHDIRVTPSIGIAVYPSDATSAADLLKHADMAMYYAKEHGRNGYQYYLPEMNRCAHERMMLEHEIRGALGSGSFYVEYQPQVRIGEGGGTESLEAFLRWRHPSGMMVAARQIVPVAEESGLIVAIDRWMVEEVCHQIRSWQEEGVTPVPVAVNLSARHFRTAEFVRWVSEVIARYGISPHLLRFDVVEQDLERHLDTYLPAIEDLQRQGMGICIDHFGRGAINMAVLQRLQPCALKLDSIYVRSLPGKDGAKITAAIIAMAAQMEIDLVAEGVESWQEHDCLVQQGCQHMQGMVICPPLGAAETARMLSQAV